jgi:hypothetical protein
MPSARAVLAGAAVLVVLLVAGIGVLASTAPTDASLDAGTPDRPDNRSLRTRVATLHDRGITGANVTVGVLDVTGFDRSRPAISDEVVAARSFGPATTVANGGRNAHGTAAATTVARVAPDADLYLATFDGRPGYRRAVQWLLSRDVDVIVAPVSFYGKPGDGSALVSEAATDAVQQGVVFVAPSGNIGQGHWTGRYEHVRNGLLYFGDDPRNRLRGSSEQVTVWLSWTDDDEDYSIELYATDGTETRLVARSRSYPGDDVPNERIVADVGDADSYFVVVRGPENATGTRLSLTSPTHRLDHATRAGSVVAPATARGVIGVGAYDPARQRVEPFSAWGPTADGRLGVDLVATDSHALATADGFVGSSAATPVVGGTAALVTQVAPGLSPLAVERVLEGTAVDVGPNGTDPGAGYGRVRPGRAVRVAENTTG